MEVLVFLVVTSAVFVAGQRPFYAGSQPIGVYVPVITTTTTESLGDRVGEDVTTQRLPIEANGDRDLIDRLSKLPIDNQPFWFINWQALESHRNNPQTYPQRPNTFINPITPSPTVNSEFLTVKSNSELGATDSAAPNSISTIPNYVITTNANSVNTFIKNTTEILSTKFENNDSDIGTTNSVSNSDPEFSTEDPIEASSSSLPTSEVISS